MWRVTIKLCLFVWLVGIATFAVDPTSSQGDGERTPITPENVSEITELTRLGRGTIMDLTVSPDGETLAVMTSVGVWLYDIVVPDPQAEPALLPKQTGTTMAGTFVAWNNDGTQVAMGEGQYVTIWDIETGEIVRQLFTSELIYGLAFTPGDEAIYVGDRDGGITRLNFDEATVPDENTEIEDFEPEVIPVQTDDVLEMLYAPDRSTLATLARRGQIIIVDPTTLELIQTLDVTSVNDFAYSPDGANFAVLDTNFQLFLFDTATWELAWQYQPENARPAALAFTPDSTQIALGNGTDSISYVDVASGAAAGEPIEITVPGAIDRLGIFDFMTFTPDGSEIMALNTSGPSDQLIVLNATTAEIRAQTQSHNLFALSVVFSPDSGYMSFVLSDGDTYTWDVNTPPDFDELPVVINGTLNIEGSQDVMLYSPDGASLVMLSASNELGVYDAATLEAVYVTRLGRMNDAAFFADGALLALVGDPGTGGLRYGVVVDFATGEVLHEWGDDSLGREVNTVAISPDETLIAIAGNDGTVRVYGILE